MRSASIRRSLLLRCGMGIGLLQAVLFAGTYLMVRHHLYRELDNSIHDIAGILSNQVELEDGALVHEWQEGLGTNSALIEGALFQFWDESSGIATRSPALQDRDLPRFCGASGAPLLRNIELPGGRPGRAIGLRVHPFVLPGEQQAMAARGRVIEPSAMPQTLVVARDAEPVVLALSRLRIILAAGGLLTLGLGYLLIDRAIRSSLRPIRELARQVEGRSPRQLDEALDLPEDLPSELTSLAENFDRLLTRVAATRERERDFIHNAAHELRTPIAGLRATTDLALSRPRQAADYIAHLQSCGKTAAELGELVKRLSALARLGQSSPAGGLQPVDLSQFLGECIPPFLPLAAQRSLTLRNTLPHDKLIAAGDPVLLRVIFNNLLDNAVSYATGGGEILIDGRPESDGIVVRFANPIDFEIGDPDRMFEPLFRQEASRHDAGSHLGIGLTLSLDAALAMGGTLRADRSSAGKGIEFTLVLPAADLSA